MVLSLEKGGSLHLVRYGISSEQKHLSEFFLNTYDILLINANMAIHTPAALAGFIAERAKNKEFIIDPQTHAFQHDISLLQVTGDEDSAPRLRRSMERLIDTYGEPIKSKASAGQVVLPEDFADKAVKDSFSERVGCFQLDTLRMHAEDKGLTDYFNFVGIAKPVTPLGVVAPYFFMEPSTVETWLPVNLDLIEATAKRFGPECQIYAELVISKDVLYDDDLRKTIADGYSRSPVSAVLLWIDDFSEHAAPLSLLRLYIDLLTRIGQSLPVVMLYGSYLSIALMRYVPETGLIGVSHGLEYGEDRAVIPAVGGLPVSKFYYPEVHKRIRFSDAFRMARPFLSSTQAYLSNVCSCRTCKDVMATAPPDEAFALYGKSHPVTFKRRNQVVTLNYPDTDTRDKCVQHYMHNKQREFADTNQGMEETIDQLRMAFEKHKRVLGLSEINHCVSWAQLLEEHKGL